MVLQQSSDVIVITPSHTHERYPHFTIPSRYICDRIFRGLRNEDARKFWDMGQIRSSAGWMWEGYVIQYLEEGTEELVLAPVSLQTLFLAPWHPSGASYFSPAQ